MKNDNFFTDKPMEDQVQETNEVKEPESFTFGEKTYNRDQMEKLVGLGEIAKEAEEKYSTRIDRVWPEYTKAQQRLAEIDRQQSEKQVQDIQNKANQGQQLTPDEIKKQAATQLAEIMRDPMIQEVISQNYNNQRQVERWDESISSLISQAKEDGKPVPTRDDIFKHMVDTGIKSPEKAYKDLYETELDQWKERQLQRIKQPGLITNSTSTAGSKNPNPVKVTAQNLSQLLHEEIERSAGERG